jgi:hypothetical protein
VHKSIATLAVRAVFTARAARFIEEQPRPEQNDIVIDGAGDQVSLLVCGSGLAVGYGVTDYRLTLAGHLAQLFAARSGNSVRVTTSARPRVPLRDMPSLLRDLPAPSYDGILWTPGFLEASRAHSPGQRREFDAMIETCRALSAGWTALLGVPTVRGSGISDALAGVEVNRANRRFEEWVDGTGGTYFVAPPAVPTIRYNRAFDFNYYRSCALNVVSAIQESSTPIG